MPLAADYPLLDVFWTMLIFFIWVAWFILLFRIIADIFRRHDIGGGAKTLWVIFTIVLPFLGVFTYLLTQNDGMTERNQKQMEQAQAQSEAYIRSVAGSGGGAASEIEKAKGLLDSGAITQAEYDSIKQKALSGA